jgi:hypothetical protein
MVWATAERQAGDVEAVISAAGMATPRFEESNGACVNAGQNPPG